MKKKIISVILIISILLIKYPTFVYADTVVNNGIKFIGGIKQLNKFYDGDTIFKDDFSVDGYCVDTDNNIINLSDTNIVFQERANINNPIVAYTILDINNPKSSYNGILDATVLPFDATVNPSSVSIKPVTFLSGTDWETNVSAYVMSEIKKIKFVNNLGKNLKYNEATWTFDTSNLKTTVGTYEISYSGKFYSNNTRNEYNTVSGTIEVNIVDKLQVSQTTGEEVSLTANSVTFEDIGMTYDVNIQNKVSGSGYSWSSSNKSVATITSAGLITSVGKGSCTVSSKITMPDGSIKTLSLKVMVGITDEALPDTSEKELALEVGNTFDLGCVNKISGSLYKYISSDKTVVKTTSLTGKLTALSIGEVEITLRITTPDKDIILRKCSILVE